MDQKDVDTMTKCMEPSAYSNGPEMKNVFSLQWLIVGTILKLKFFGLF